MASIRKILAAALVLILGASLLSGCARMVENAAERQRITRAANAQASAYVRSTLGAAPRVLDTELEFQDAGFSGYYTGDALVTVSLNGETFQVYVDTSDEASCRDNRAGLRLADALDVYFRDLYGLPPALEHSIRLYFDNDGFFASYPTHVAHHANFLPFDYTGQPLETVLPLLDQVRLTYNYADDAVSLDALIPRDKDWGGDAGRLSLRVQCFRLYDPDAPVPVGLLLDKNDPPVLMADGMAFSRRYTSYGSLDDIASTVPEFALRDAVYYSGGELQRTCYQLTSMGSFWISSPAELDPADFFQLVPYRADWSGLSYLLSDGYCPYFTKEELQSGYMALDGDLPPEAKEIASSTLRTLRPYYGATYRSTGEMLCFRTTAATGLENWTPQGPYAQSKNPFYVMTAPSLVYQADTPMALGLLYTDPDSGVQEPRIKVFSSHQDKEARWLNALTYLEHGFPRPVDGMVLLTVSDLRGPS